MKPKTRIAALPAVLLLMAGCAALEPFHVTVPWRELWSTREAQPKRDAQPGQDTQSDQRIAAVEGRMHEMDQRLDAVDGQVQTLERGVAGAQSRAEAAAKAAERVDSRLTRLWSNRFNQKAADSLEVYFSPDSIGLTDAAQTVLAAVAKEMEAHPTLTVELGGYTDPRGALDYNYGLSQRRVDAVRRFLMDKGIQLARIQAASLGPIANPGIPDAKKRRVTVRLMVDSE
ncbi:MAG: OmpA family protein [Candidatus Rokuibacteriota bacterium]